MRLKTPPGPPPLAQVLSHPPLLGMVAGEVRPVYYEPGIGFYLAGATAYDGPVSASSLRMHVPFPECPFLFIEKQPVACTSWQVAPHRGNR